MNDQLPTNPFHHEVHTRFDAEDIVSFDHMHMGRLVQRAVMNLKEKSIQEALVKLGWSPPTPMLKSPDQPGWWIVWDGYKPRLCEVQELNGRVGLWIFEDGFWREPAKLLRPAENWQRYVPPTS